MLAPRSFTRLARPTSVSSAPLSLSLRIPAYYRAASFQPYHRPTPSALDNAASLSSLDAQKFATDKTQSDDRQSASPPKFSQQSHKASEHHHSALCASQTSSSSSSSATPPVSHASSPAFEPATQPAVSEPTPATASTATSASAQATGPAVLKRQSRLRTPRKAAITLTSAAVQQLRDLLDQPEPKLIRVGVRNRGCSGLAYHLEYVDKPAAFDEKVEQDGVMVLIDSKALFSIIGSEMDWVEDNLIEKFVFKNPNIKDQCGCGESFMV